MHTPRIAAVVVTYNRLPLLRRCLAALAACRAACPGAALDLWVIDNASTDGTGAAMAAWADPGPAALPGGCGLPRPAGMISTG